MAGTLLLLAAIFGVGNSFNNLKPGQIPIALVRTLSPFTEVDTSAPFSVFIDISPTNEEKVTVTGLNRTVLEWIQTSVSEKVLKIRMNTPPQNPNSISGLFGNNGLSIFGTGTIVINGVTVSGNNNAQPDPMEAEIYVSAKTLTGVTASGSGSVEVKSPVAVSSFRISASGQGGVAIPSVKLDDLQASITGSGSVTISGTATRATIGVHGTGAFDGMNLQTSSTNAIVSGTGNVRIGVAVSLMGSASGIGSIKYIGSPTVSVQTMGLGTVGKL